MAIRRFLDRFSTILAIVVGAVGLGIMAYPTVADWWNSMHSTYAVANYDEFVASMDPHEYDELFERAREYNESLVETGPNWMIDGEELAAYNRLLDVTGTGMLGYIDIPKIDVSLPIYHGTSDAVLKLGVGHLAGTSLPIGGVGTHASMSGHRGLPSARLFTDLNLLRVGDLFTVTVLNKVCTYEVDQIRIVLPTYLADLDIDPDKDYVTLITCTPYGVNSHRLLVRGHRVGDLEGDLVVLAEAIRIKPVGVAIILLIPVIVIIVIWTFVLDSSQMRHHKERDAAREALRLRRARRQGFVDSDAQMEGEEPRGEE